MIKRGYTDMLTTTKHTVEPMQGEADAGNLCTKVHMFGTHGQSRTHDDIPPSLQMLGEK